MNLTKNEIILLVLAVIAIAYIVFRHSTVVHDEGFDLITGYASKKNTNPCNNSCNYGICKLSDGRCGCMNKQKTSCMWQVTDEQDIKHGKAYKVDNILCPKKNSCTIGTCIFRNNKFSNDKCGCISLDKNTCSYYDSATQVIGSN